MGERDDMRERLLAALDARGLLAPDGLTTVYGQPAWRSVPEGHAPQALMGAGALQRRLVACAAGTAAMGADQCAAWVERAFSRLGVGYVSGDARELYEGFCHLDDTGDLLVGMICAVGRAPYGAGGWDHGHVGLYVGDNEVMDCADGRVRRAPLELWLSAYGVASEPRWGWLGGIGLA
ncbi:hypothetical protein [Thermophilibacter sp.]